MGNRISRLFTQLRSDQRPSFPCSVKGKFSIRLVPNLTIKNTTDLVVKFVNEEFKKLGSKNKCEVALTHGGEPWIVSRSFLAILV